MSFRNFLFNISVSVIIFLLLPTIALATDYEKVEADYILQQIQNGEDIHLENCLVVGDLNISKIELETISNPEEQSSMEIEKYRDTGKTYPLKNRNRDLKVIKSDINFTNCIFKNKLDFSDTLFKERAWFIRCALLNFSTFDHTYFNNVEFSYTVFGFVTFTSTTFNNDAYFIENHFKGPVVFRSASFKNDSIFGSSIFYDYVSFQNTSFEGDTFFKGTQFKNNTVFRGTFFEKGADFMGADFKNGADFSYSHFGNSAGFNDSSFVENIDFYPAYFEDIYLFDFKFTSMEINWASLENSLNCDEITYLRLIENFKKNGQYEDADAAYYKYRQEMQNAKGWFSYSKWEDIILCCICGYGVKPFYSIRFGAAVVLLFCIIYLKGPTIYWNRTPSIRFLGPGIYRFSENGMNQKISIRDAFYFSVFTFTFTSLGYSDWHPKDNFRKWVMLEATLGWLTLGMFLVAFVNVTMRP